MDSNTRAAEMASKLLSVAKKAGLDAKGAVLLARDMNCAPAEVVHKVQSAASSLSQADRELVEVALVLGTWAGSQLKWTPRTDREGERLGYAGKTIRRNVGPALDTLAAALEVRSPVPHTPIGSFDALEIRELARMAAPKASLSGWEDWLVEGQYVHRTEELLWEYAAGLAHTRDQVLQRAQVEGAQRIVDLGCGVGFVTEPIRRLAGSEGEVLAVDHAEGALSILSSAFQRTHERGMASVSVVHGSVDNLPSVPDSSVDCVVIHNVLVFLSVDQFGASIREMARILATGGRFAVFEGLPSDKGLHGLELNDTLNADLIPTHRAIRSVQTSDALDANVSSSLSDPAALVARFRAEGFSEVNAKLEVRSAQHYRFSSPQVDHLINGQPMALVGSYADAAREVVPHPERYLRAVKACILRSPMCTESIGTLVWGSR